MTPDQKRIEEIELQNNAHLKLCADTNYMPAEPYIQIDFLCAQLTAAQKREQDLVEAGKWVLNVISGVGRSGGPIDPMDDEPEAAFDSLKRLIEQAEGGGE